MILLILSSKRGVHNSCILFFFNSYLAAVSLVLNIDTAVQTASVCVAEDDKVIGIKTNPSQKDQASWLQPAIAALLEEHNFSSKSLDAVAVSAGPGSYTGLRVGMATAKGLCYALNIPLISVNTLQMMAVAALQESADLLCPMIDARRMEVFTAVYKKTLEPVVLPTNAILTADTCGNLLEKNTILFFGNGSNKFKGLSDNPNAHFKEIEATAEHMPLLSHRYLHIKSFTNLAYSVPDYGKEYFSTTFNLPM